MFLYKNTMDKLNGFAKNYRWNEEKENFLYLILVI
jgi:hypothetical protein